MTEARIKKMMRGIKYQERQRAIDIIKRIVGERKLGIVGNLDGPALARILEEIVNG